VTPQDVNPPARTSSAIAIIVSYEAEAESITSETIIERVFAGLPVP